MNELLNQRANFYQTHLNRVSRSFAVGIEKLDLVLRLPVALSYLICRLLDTVEDAPWVSFYDQERAFDQFNSFLTDLPQREEVSQWIRSFPREIPEGEQLLLADSVRIFSDLHHGPKDERDAILGPVLSMSAGMKHYMKRKGESRVLELRSIAEVDRYCFFVAGLVGELLTGLLRLRSKDLGVAERELDSISDVDAFRFGLFLQKVNILKDQRADEAEGRKLVPSRAEVRASLERDARGALRYLTSIPVHLERYRLFCAWALYLGLASLPQSERAYSEKSKAKIPRLSALLLLGKVERRISDNQSLERLFEELAVEAFPGGLVTSVNMVCLDNEPGENLSEILGLYCGKIPAVELQRWFEEPA